MGRQGLSFVSPIRAALAPDDGALLAMIRKAGLDKVNVGGLGFDVAKSPGGDYVSWFVANTGLEHPLDIARTLRSFERTAWRPEVLVHSLGELADENGALLDVDHLDDAFEAAVEAAIEESDEATLKVVRALTPLQGAVLRVMAMQAEEYTPHAAASLAAYTE